MMQSCVYRFQSQNVERWNPLRALIWVIVGNAKAVKNETNLETISGSSKLTHPNGLNGIFKDFVELV